MDHLGRHDPAATLGFISVRDARNEYRVGNEFKVFGYPVNWMHGWEDFKEDFLATSQTGANGDADRSTIHESLPRHQPLLARGAVHGQEMVQHERPVYLHGLARGLTSMS